MGVVGGMGLIQNSFSEFLGRNFFLGNFLLETFKILPRRDFLKRTSHKELLKTLFLALSVRELHTKTFDSIVLLQKNLKNSVLHFRSRLAI